MALPDLLPGVIGDVRARRQAVKSKELWRWDCLRGYINWTSYLEASSLDCIYWRPNPAKEDYSPCK